MRTAPAKITDRQLSNQEFVCTKRTRERALPKNFGPLQKSFWSALSWILVHLPDRGGKRTARGGSKTPFREGRHSWGFPPPSCFNPLSLFLGLLIVRANRSRDSRKQSEVAPLQNPKIRNQEGSGSLGGENPAAFPQAWPIFQQPFSLPENAQTLAGIALSAARKSANNFPAASKFARKLFLQGIWDSHSLLAFSEKNLF